MPAIRIEQNIFVVRVETCAGGVAVEQESFDFGGGVEHLQAFLRNFYFG